MLIPFIYFILFNVNSLFSSLLVVLVRIYILTINTDDEKINKDNLWVLDRIRKRNMSAVFGQIIIGPPGSGKIARFLSYASIIHLVLQVKQPTPRLYKIISINAQLVSVVDMFILSI